MAFLDINRLHKQFGDTIAVSGFDLDVEQGELLSLLGPSGCGKTTALRMIAGFERPTSGTIHPVSYTHLDVYKRQAIGLGEGDGQLR